MISHDAREPREAGLPDLATRLEKVVVEADRIVIVPRPPPRRDGAETTFTRSDGTTGTAADVTFSYDAAGHLVAETVTHNSDGSTTIDNKAYNADGRLASETTSTTSADGLDWTLAFDDNGDGVIDRRQTDDSVLNADGSTTETVSNYSAGMVLENRTFTTTSENLKTVSIERDINGDGFYDQAETDSIGTGGSLAVTVTDLNRDGTRRDELTTTTSADGLSKTMSLQLTGNGVVNETETDDTTVACDGTRTETVTDYAGTGMGASNEVGRTVTTTSADGQSKTTTSDLNGDGIVDLTSISSIAVEADDSSISTRTDFNADGSLRDRSVETISADDLTKTIQTALGGDGTFDVETVDATSFDASGTKTETTSTFNGDGTILTGQTLTITSADGKTRTIETDSRGAGWFDRIETIAPAVGGGTVDTVSNYGGALIRPCTGTSRSSTTRQRPSAAIANAYNGAKRAAPIPARLEGNPH